MITGGFFTMMRPESLLSNTVSECESVLGGFSLCQHKVHEKKPSYWCPTPASSSLPHLLPLNCNYYLQRKRAKPLTAPAARHQRLGLLGSRQDLLENLLVKRGEDQLVVVDQAAEADGELLQLLADREETAGQWRRGPVLAGLQGGQQVALNAGV